MYHYLKERERIGPIDFEGVVEKIKSGEISSTTMVWKEGTLDWVEAKNLEEFKEILYSVPPPIPSLAPPPMPYERNHNANIEPKKALQFDVKNNEIIALILKNWIPLVGLLIGVAFILFDKSSITNHQVEITGEMKAELIKQYLPVQILRTSGIFKNHVIDGDINVRFKNTSGEFTFDVRQIGGRYTNLQGKRQPPFISTVRVFLRPGESETKSVSVPKGIYERDPYAILDQTTVTTTKIVETKTPIWFKVLGWFIIAVSVLLFINKNSAVRN